MASLAVNVEVMSSTDPVGFVDSFGTFGEKCENDYLTPDGCTEECDDMIEVVSLEKHEPTWCLRWLGEILAEHRFWMMFPYLVKYQQAAVMFQIVSVLVLDMPEASTCLD